MVAPPIPRYEDPCPPDPLNTMADFLRTAGWAPLVEPLDQASSSVHVFVARSNENPNIPLEEVQDQLSPLLQILPPDDQLIIAVAERGSAFAGRTFVDYKGPNGEYLRRLIGGLTSLGANARSDQASHVKKMEVWGTTGGLAVLGVAYALLQHRK